METTSLLVDVHSQRPSCIVPSTVQTYIKIQPLSQATVFLIIKLETWGKERNKERGLVNRKGNGQSKSTSQQASNTCRIVNYFYAN